MDHPSCQLLKKLVEGAHEVNYESYKKCFYGDVKTNPPVARFLKPWFTRGGWVNGSVGEPRFDATQNNQSRKPASWDFTR